MRLGDHVASVKEVYAFSLVLIIVGLLTWVEVVPVTFGDTERYWDKQVGLQKVIDFSDHLGAFIPAAVFAILNDPIAIMAFQFGLWLATGILSFLAVYFNLENPWRRFLSMAVIFFIWTSTLLLPWNQALLADPIGLALLGYLTVVLMLGIMGTVSRRYGWAVLIAGALLLLTKPAWLLALTPLLIWFVFRLRFRKAFWIAGFSVLVVFAGIVTLSGQKQIYVEGLTYEGWQTLTRAAHFGGDPDLREAMEGRLGECTELKAVFDQLRETGDRGSMTVSYPQAIESCPWVVDYLNSTPSPLVNAFFQEPAASLKLAFSNLTAVNWPPDDYVASPANAWFPMSLLWSLFNSGALFGIFSLATLGFILYGRYRRLVALTLFLIFIGTMTFIVLTDGLEPLRHSIPFKLIAFTGLLLLHTLPTSDTASLFGKKQSGNLRLEP